MCELCALGLRSDWLFSKGPAHIRTKEKHTWLERCGYAAMSLRLNLDPRSRRMVRPNQSQCKGLGELQKCFLLVNKLLFRKFEAEHLPYLSLHYVIYRIINFVPFILYIGNDRFKEPSIKIE